MADLISRLAQELGIPPGSRPRAPSGCWTRAIPSPSSRATGRRPPALWTTASCARWEERLAFHRAVEARREEVRRLIDEQGSLSASVAAALDAAGTVTEIDDVYRPFRPKRRTRASIAAEAGLTPLADLLWAQDAQTDPHAAALPFADAEKGVPDAEAALKGAMDILAERVSDDADVRKWVREYTFKNGTLVCRAKKKEEDSVYRAYYDYAEPLRRVPPHRILAIDRGEREGFLSVRVEVNADYIRTYLQSRTCRGESRCPARMSRTPPPMRTTASSRPRCRTSCGAR